MDSEIERLVAALQDAVGDGLRGVFYGEFRERDYAVAYASEAALDGYSADQIGDVVDDVALEKLHSDRKSELHEPLGEYTASVEVFEDGVNVVVLEYDVPTVFVEMDGDVTNVSPALEAGRDALG
ncbi:hypothetical protein M0R88_14665 [Halorussus gelatinilyticus]|uniref:Uncharacterized protein n=1 Tax=Halorussus gelatinilyticus TaxID=2937524 RepID=A0A8U0IF99_9EURY|nr:hypothetical protein [Halorussus gelatinilyticus]UPV99749.1 hypothetical protein M0R88_14665 [Halorussus gelatinilyticus]